MTQTTFRCACPRRERMPLVAQMCLQNLSSRVVSARQMVATCKHFIANSLEHSTINGKTITRHNFDAEIPLSELTDYYMPGFKSCVQEGRGLGISA